MSMGAVSGGATVGLVGMLLGTGMKGPPAGPVGVGMRDAVEVEGSLGFDDF